MLDGFARHGLFDLSVSVDGDLDVDGHHTIEDTGIVLGTAIREAVGDKQGIRRYGDRILPMDETLVLSAVDLCGRPYLSFQAEFTREKVGEMETEMVKEFFYAVSYAAQMNLHIKVLDGGITTTSSRRCSKHLRRHSMRQLPSIRELPACSRPRAACKSRKRGEQEMKQALKCDFTWADFKTNSDGMVPVVVQDAENDEVLMLAYMNEEAFETTLRLGKMTYWSRSRNELWTKGLSSGHVQYVKQLLIDCDNDTILAKVEQVGAACHTGNRTCFYRTLAE